MRRRRSANRNRNPKRKPDAMKTRCFRFTVAALLAGSLAFAASTPSGKVKRNADGTVDLESEMPPDAKKLKIGDRAPDFKLKGVDGKTYSLADFKAPLLMVAFLSNHCPYSHAAETRLLPLAREFK